MVHIADGGDDGSRASTSPTSTDFTSTTPARGLVIIVSSISLGRCRATQHCAEYRPAAPATPAACAVVLDDSLRRSGARPARAQHRRSPPRSAPCGTLLHHAEFLCACFRKGRSAVEFCAVLIELLFRMSSFLNRVCARSQSPRAWSLCARRHLQPIVPARCPAAAPVHQFVKLRLMALRGALSSDVGLNGRSLVRDRRSQLLVCRLRTDDRRLVARPLLIELSPDRSAR